VLGTKKCSLSLQVERDALNTWQEGMEITFDQLSMWRKIYINSKFNDISVTSALG
jgi:hypothetical protein